MVRGMPITKKMIFVEPVFLGSIVANVSQLRILGEHQSIGMHPLLGGGNHRKEFFGEHQSIYTNICGPMCTTSKHSFIDDYGQREFILAFEYFKTFKAIMTLHSNQGGEYAVSGKS